MDADLLIVLTATIAIGVTLIIMVGRKQPITMHTLTEGIADARTLAAELADVAKVGVSAVEQLKASGVITDNDEALAHAVDHVNRWFEPLGVHLDAQVVENAAESAYFALRVLQTQIDKPVLVVPVPGPETTPGSDVGPL